VPVHAMKMWQEEV